MVMSKKFKIIVSLTAVVGILAATPFVTYLKILPWAVSNPKVINYAEKMANKYLDLDIQIRSPELKTSLSTIIEFKVDELSVSKKSENLLRVNNFDTIISFKEIFDKNIIIKKLGADYIFADVNKLIALSQPKKEEQKEKSDWDFDFFDSLLYVKKSKFLYKIEPSTYVTLKADDLRIDNTQKVIRYVHFNLTSDIKKDGKNLHFNFADRNAVFIKNKAIWVQNCYLIFNDSKIFFNAWADKKKNYKLEVFSKNIDVTDVLALINSGIVENNLNEPLSYFKDLKGSFNFNIKLSNSDMRGVVNLNKISCKIIPVSNIPILLQKGKIDLTKTKITLSDFKGYYNNKQTNKIEMQGTVDDYLKSIDTKLVARAVVTNDFMLNYLSKMVGTKIELVGGSTKTRLDFKSKNNKIDLLWLFGVKKGQDILVDGASLTPVNYIRGVKGDLHFEDNLLNIKSIDYYIVPEHFTKEQVQKIKPVVKLAGNVDFSKPEPFVKNLGFEIPRPLPSEFLNVLIGDKMFKNGKIAGKMEMINGANFPYLNGNLSMDEVFIPSQRVFVKHGEMTTSDGMLNLAAQGGYRRSKFDFTGNLLNQIKFPIVVKHTNLTIDNVDVEKFIASANNQSSQEITSEKFDVKPSGEAKDNDDNTPTFDIGNFIVEDCVLHIKEGKYKDINFNDVKATLSLDKNSVLNMYSNRFAIAEGHSSAKVNCDLKKHKYNLRLGILDVNSDIIATTLLTLPREISGKASGLIELNTDDKMKLNGSVKFIVKDGTIQKIGLVEYILKFAALFRNPLVMISPSTFSDLVNIPEGKFNNIKGSLEIRDNVVERMMIKSTAPQLSSFIIGRYDIERSDASLRIYTKFSNHNKGFAGFLRNISLNSLANRIPLSSRNDSNYYSAEISQLPPIDADEKDCQIFLTKVDGDIEHNNFISSLKKIK